MQKQSRGRVRRARIKTGLAVMSVSVPFGYIGIALGAVAFARTRHPSSLWLGVWLYAASWVLLGVGALIAGPPGYQAAKLLWRRRLRARRRMTRLGK